MNKFFIKITKRLVLAGSILCIVLSSCSEMNDVHSEYLDGEHIYSAKADSAGVRLGLYRVMLDIAVGTQRVETVRIYWDNYADSADLAVNSQTGIFSKLIENLEERDYIFNLVSIDEFGNRSLPVEILGTVYGNAYASRLRITTVESSIVDNGGWHIFLGNAGDNAYATEIEYSQDGTVKTVSIPISTKDTLIAGAKPQAGFRYRTFYMQDNFIEPVPSAYREAEFPAPGIRPVNAVTKFGNGYAIALGALDVSYSDIFYRNVQGQDVSLRVSAGEPAAYLYDYDGSGFSQQCAYLFNPPNISLTEKIPYTGTVGDVSVTVTSTSPAILRAGDFDLGGEGVGFHDANTSHDPGTGANYRSGLGDYLGAAMDIEGDDGENIGYTVDGEWLMYTVEVLNEGDYEIDWYISVANDGAACHVEVDGVASAVYQMVSNGNWTDWRYYCEQNGVAPPVFHLTAGKHTIKYAFNSGGFNYNGMRVALGNLKGGILNSAKAYWQFDDPFDVTKASIGSPLIKQGEGFTFVYGPKAGDGAVQVAKGSYFKALHGMAANGGGSRVNNYSVMFDFKVPELGRYYSFIQTTLENNDDAEFFLRPAGNLGIGGTGYSEHVVTTNKWHRLVISASMGNAYLYYLDGRLIHTGNIENASIDSRWSWLPEGVLFLADDDGEDADIDVSNIAVWDRALSEEEVDILGGVE
jgi:hypothetical protein